jgi:hypothetical protein
MDNVVIADIITSKVIFTGTRAQCAWFIDVKGLTVHATDRSGDTLWVK